MTAAATPVSAAAKHQYDQNDNEDQFHENSPLMPTALFAAHPSSQRQLQSIVPGKSVSRQYALDRAAQMDRTVALRCNNPTLAMEQATRIKVAQRRNRN